VAIDRIDIVEVGVNEILNKSTSGGEPSWFCSISTETHNDLAWAGLFNRKHFAGGLTVSGQQFSSKWVKRGPAPEGCVVFGPCKCDKYTMAYMQNKIG
jgi:hypothetical protein